MRHKKLDQVEKGADIQLESPVEMPFGELFYGAVDSRRSTMNQPRKVRTLFLYREAELFQTSITGQIRTTQHNGQTFLAGDRLQVFGSFFVAEIIRNYLSARAREAK